jgi:hypothetical protein
MGSGEVRIDATTPTDILLRRADLLVTISTSGTLWNEALALRVPLVAYLDPTFTVVSAEYATDLAEACMLCKNGEELRSIVRHVAIEGKEFLRRFAEKRVETFLRRYVLANSNSVETVVEFLAALARPRFQLANGRPQ